MKRSVYRRYLAIFVLLIFSLGQSLLYGHSHVAIHSSSKDVAHHANNDYKVSAKCSLCDLAIHSQMFLPSIAPDYSLLSVEFKWINNLNQYKGNFYIQANGLSPPDTA